jgi:hypothetical protein
MQYAAPAIGSGVPAGDFIGCVAEVHTRAALLALDNGSQVTLLALELGCQPCGISFDAPADLSLRSGLAIGVGAAARAGMLRVAHELTIDLRGAQRWRCGVKKLRIDFSGNKVTGAYRAARSALDKDGRSDRFCRTNGATLDALDHAMRLCDVGAAASTMSRLIGLGAGRTPEGDDYLVGYFAALWACSEASRRFAAALAPGLRTLAMETGHLSRCYLQAAAGGEVSERIAVVAAVIASGSEQDVIDYHIAAALAVGQTSGAAAMLGFLRGCSACAEDNI